VLLAGCADSHADLRQCCAYGLGILAARGGDAFKPYLPEALARLTAMVAAPDARDDDNELATDNAIGALGKILAHQAGGGPEGAALAGTWLAALPVLGDAVEAQAVHEQLVAMCEAQDPRLLGDAGRLPKLAGVLVAALSRGTELVTPEVGRRAVALLAALQGTAGAAMSAAFAALSPKQQGAFTAWMAGGVPS